MHYRLHKSQRNGVDKPRKYKQGTFELGRRTDGILGHFVLMDIVKLPASQLYRPQQTQDDRLHKRGITGIFPRDLFDYILKYFYYNTSENVPHKDNPEYKLYQVKPDIEELSKKFLELYDPHSHRAQSIDEAMIKFKDRPKFLQYMPMKPVKRGMKIWCRCDLENGYLDQMDVLGGKKYFVVMDNFFSNVELFKSLFDEQVFLLWNCERK